MGCVELSKKLQGHYFIFQLKKDAESREFLFMGKQWHEKHGREISVSNYELSFGGPLFNKNSFEELEDIFVKFNLNRPDEFKGHSLSVSDVIVTVSDEGIHAYFIDSFGYLEEPAFLDAWGTRDVELAFRIADRFVSLQTSSGGYDWYICDESYSELDGGIYDDCDASMLEVLNEVIMDNLKASVNFNNTLKGAVLPESMLVPVNYGTLVEQMEEVDIEKVIEGRVIAEYREKTKSLFHPVDGLSANEIEQRVLKYVCDAVRLSYPDSFVSNIGTAVLIGSRSRGLERSNSDIDIVVDYTGDIKEYQLFNLLNEEPFMIGEVSVDINPIRKEESGTLKSFLPRADAYLEQKKNTYFRVYWKLKGASDSEIKFAYARAYDKSDAMKVVEMCLNLDKYEVTDITPAKKHQITKQNLVLNCMDVIYELKANY